MIELSFAKLLLLAGTDRLDRELTSGQMQGRFQLALLLQALPAAGVPYPRDCTLPSHGGSCAVLR